MRLTGSSVDCYKYLEPLYNDYRKIKQQNRNGGELCVCPQSEIYRLRMVDVGGTW